MRFAALLALVAAARLALLLTSQGALHGDEATVAVMALRLLANGEWPVFAANAPYNGGAAVMAWIGAAVFAVAGPSERALKLVAWVISLLALAAVYALVRAARGRGPALAAAAVYGTSVALLKWNFDVRGAYLECQLLTPLAFWCLHAWALRAARPWPAEVALWLLCGLGFYLLPIFLPVALTVLVFLGARHGLRGAASRLPVWAGAFALGSAPVWVMRAGVEPALRLDPGRAPWAAWRTLTEWLPRAFAYDNLYGYPSFRLVPNGIEAGFLVLALVALLAARGRVLTTGRPPPPAPAAPPLEAILLAHVGLFLVLFALHAEAGRNARYLLFLEPTLSVLAGLGAFEALRPGRPRALRAAALAVVAVVAVERGAQWRRLLADRAVYGSSGVSDPAVADVVLVRLQEAGIRTVMLEDWDLRWRLAFKSRQQVETHHLSHRWFRDPPAAVRQAPRYGILVQAGGHTEGWLRAHFSARGLSVPRAEMAGITLYVCEGAAGCGQPVAH